MALRRRIEESLGRLESETLISRSGDNYSFLTNEERDINKEIKQVDLSSGDEAKLQGEIIFEDVLKGQRKHRFTANKMDFEFNRRCDQFPIGNQKDGALLVSVITPLADDYDLYDKGKAILDSTTEGGCVLVRLGNDESLGRNQDWASVDLQKAPRGSHLQWQSCGPAYATNRAGFCRSLRSVQRMDDCQAGGAARG